VSTLQRALVGVGAGIALVSVYLIWPVAFAQSSASNGIAGGVSRSGFEFLGPDLKDMQNDEFANPGSLWVERGEKLWSAAPTPGGASCASCHGDAKQSMKGVAARYPVVDRASGRLMTVERRIEQCRVERQKAPPLAAESQDLLALSAWVSRQSRGMPIEVSIDGPARAPFEAGRALFFKRFGQMNLSCAQCHDANWDKRLFAGSITQGHPNAYPGYRLEWQAFGSLERRLRACLSGVRAEMFPYGADEHAELALYLAWRARGLPVESPGVRR
jgi:sulfur-oxidizing protein SoxA